MRSLFSKMRIMQSTKNCWEQLEKLQGELAAAEAVVIGAGAGLSAAAGFTYSGERFRQYFSDFEARYGFHDMYAGGFYPYSTPEEHWAYWSRYIYINRYMEAPEPVYGMLLELVRNKNYFVITTNVDHCFQRAGFDKKRLFYTQGDYSLFQCSVPCCQETFENEAVIRAMLEQQKNMRVPAGLLPVCPHCGQPLTMNLRSDDKFVEDKGWHEAADRYELFIRRHKNTHIRFLELGVGYNTPGIIKYPFWRLTAQNPLAAYICINDGEAAGPGEIASQAVYINDGIGKVFGALAANTG